VERELQPHERARVPRHPDLALGQGMPGVGIPQLEGGDGAGPEPGEPGPTADVAGGLERKNGLQRSPERRRSGCVPLRHPDREGIEQDVDRPRRLGAGRRGAGGLGAVQQAASGPHRRAERLEVGHARQLDVERLEAAGRADEQPCGLPDAALVEGDLPPQLLDLRGLHRVDRPGLDRDQQLQRHVEGAGVALRSRRREQAPRAASRVGGEHRRGVEERGGGRHASACQCAPGRAFELLGDLLVGPGRRLRAVPGAPVGIEPRIRGLGQRRVQRVPFIRRRRAVGRRAHGRVTEAHLGADLEQAAVDCRRRGPRIDAELLGRSPHEQRVADGIGRRQPQQPLRVRGQLIQGRRNPSSRPDSVTGPGPPKPPASSAALMPRGSSSRASGLPRVSAMIRSRTRSSSRPGTTVASRARASSWPSPSSRSSGRSSVRRSSLGSRTPNTIAIGSASSRRATNPSTCPEAPSSHWKSSTRHSSGCSSATSANRLSVARATSKRSPASPDARPSATRRASCCGSGSASSRRSSGAQS
jgi:hypothetical protein